MGARLAKPAVESPTARLTSLAHEIEDRTKVLTTYLNAKGLEAPSLAVGGVSDFPLAGADESVRRAREDLVSLTQELRDLALGPRASLKSLGWESLIYIPVQAIAEFGIASIVPENGSITYEHLSKAIQARHGLAIPVSELKRILRLAMTMCNIFTEPTAGSVAHTSKSLLLHTDDSLVNWMGMLTIDFLSPIAHTVDAMKKWPGSEEPNETGINVAYGHPETFYAHLVGDVARANRYTGAMRSHSSLEGFERSHTVDGYAWSSLGKTTVVDVGGNDGFISYALAEAHPNLSLIVQDLPGQRTPETTGTVPPHLTDRVKLTVHDFFTPQTEVASAYFFRHIFHGFGDKYAIQILKQMVPAMRDGARIIINELVLPDPGTVPRIDEQNARLMDMLMQTACNARERDVDDWKSLFERADKRFKWHGAYKTTGRLWIIEARWEA